MKLTTSPSPRAEEIVSSEAVKAAPRLYRDARASVGDFSKGLLDKLRTAKATGIDLGEKNQGRAIEEIKGLVLGMLATFFDTHDVVEAETRAEATVLLKDTGKIPAFAKSLYESVLRISGDSADKDRLLPPAAIRLENEERMIAAITKMIEEVLGDIVAKRSALWTEIDAAAAVARALATVQKRNNGHPGNGNGAGVAEKVEAAPEGSVLEGVVSRITTEYLHVVAGRHSYHVILNGRKFHGKAGETKVQIRPTGKRSGAKPDAVLVD